jgi:O-antigen/teichoic acid export membrane protein
MSNIEAPRAQGAAEARPLAHPREPTVSEGRLIGQSAMFMAGRLLPSAIAFLALAIYTRLLTPEEYGQYGLLDSAAQVGVLVAIQWLALAGLRLSASRPGDRQLRASLLVWFLALLGGSALCWAAAAFWLLKIATGWQVMLAFLIFAASAWLEINLQILAGEMRGALFAGVNNARAVISAMMGSALVWVGAGAAGALAGAAIGAGLPGLWLYLRKWLGIWPTDADRFHLAQIARYGLPLAAAIAVFGLGRFGDRFIIVALKDTASAGLYVAGFNLADKTVGALLNPLGNAGLPLAIHRLDSEGVDGARRQFRANAALLVGLGLPAATGLVVLAPRIIELVVGPDFRAGAERVVPLIAIAALLGGFRTNYLDHAFQIGHRTGGLLTVTTGTLLTSVVLNLLLVPGYGVTGAAASAVISQAIGIVLAWSLGRRVFALPLPWREWAKAGLATAAMAALLLALPLERNLLALLLATGVGSLAYLGLAMLLDIAGLRQWAQQAGAGLSHRLRPR